MLKKYVFFVLLSIFILDIHPSLALDDYWGIQYDYKNWPGKDGAVKNNIELNVKSFLGYGITMPKGAVRYDYSDITMILPELLPIGGMYRHSGIIMIRVYPTIEEAQIDLCNTPIGMEGSNKPERIMDSPVGDVALGLEQFGFHDLYFSRANVLVSIMSIANSDTTKVLEKLPLIIDALILNAPIWKIGDPNPRLKISDEFIKTFPLPPR
jgi:hypothetical protein